MLLMAAMNILIFLADKRLQTKNNQVLERIMGSAGWDFKGRGRAGGTVGRAGDTYKTKKRLNA
jgi:hypothetical protein